MVVDHAADRLPGRLVHVAQQRAGLAHRERLAELLERLAARVAPDRAGRSAVRGERPHHLRHVVVGAGHQQVLGQRAHVGGDPRVRASSRSSVSMSISIVTDSVRTFD